MELWILRAIADMLGLMRVVLMVVATLALSGASFGFVRYLTDGGVALRWFVPAIELVVAPAPDGFDGPATTHVIDASIAAWTSLPCDPPTLTAVVDRGAALDDSDGKNSLVWVTDSATWSGYGFSATELARTLLIHKVMSGTIVDADIAVNVAGFAFSTGETCVADQYDLRSTLTHELGHFFGLDHSLDPEATMRTKNDIGDCEMRTLHADDIAGFCATYEVPVRPEPDPEPVVERVEPTVEIVEPVTPRKDDGCHSGAPALFGLALLGIRPARRATASRRSTRRASRAR